MLKPHQVQIGDQISVDTGGLFHEVRAIHPPQPGDPFWTFDLKVREGHVIVAPVGSDALLWVICADARMECG